MKCNELSSLIYIYIGTEVHKYLSLLDLGEGLLDLLRFLELSYSAALCSDDLGLGSYLGSYRESTLGSIILGSV